jgi:hypothetical protein
MMDLAVVTKSDTGDIEILEILAALDAVITE